MVAAGSPVVATTSGGVAATLGYEDREGAPADEMLAAAARIARGVEVPVTVDAEAGYGMEPAELVATLRTAGAAGCNLEDTDHAAGSLRDPDRHAEWLAAVREAASENGYRLVITARVDVFLGPYFAGAGGIDRSIRFPKSLLDRLVWWVQAALAVQHESSHSTPAAGDGRKCHDLPPNDPPTKCAGS